MTETAVELNIEVPEGMRLVVGEHPVVSAKVICPCVVRTMEAEAGGRDRSAEEWNVLNGGNRGTIWKPD